MSQAKKNAILIVVALLIMMALYACRVQVAELLCPIFKILVSLLEERLSVAELSVVDFQHELVFQLRLVSAAPVVLYGREFPAMDVSATTLVTYTLQHVYISFIVLGLGVLYQKVNALRVMCFALPAMMLSIMLDAPLELLGAVEGLFLQNLAPQLLESNPIVLWSDALNGGLRLALPLTFGLICIALSKPEGESLNLKKATSVE